jgi:hypothetical protein
LSIRNIIFAVTLLGFCSLISGCLPVREAQVYGTYKLSAKWGNSTLELRRDHTFDQQVFVTSTGQKRELEGKWKFSDPSEHGFTRGIIFFDWIDVSSDRPGKDASGASLSVEPMGFGTMEIAVDEVEHYSYIK